MVYKIFFVCVFKVIYFYVLYVIFVCLFYNYMIKIVIFCWWSIFNLYVLKGEGNKILIVLKLGGLWKKGGLGNIVSLY